MNKHMAVAAVGVAVLFSVAAVSGEPRQFENWPKPYVGPTFRALGAKGAAEEKAVNRNYYRPADPYRSDGKLLWFSSRSFAENDRIKHDDAGIPTVKYRGKFYYNPVTISQFALSAYGKYLDGKADKGTFLDAANKLIEMQSDDGSYRITYPSRRYLVTLDYRIGAPAGGMDYGQAMSVFARAYAISGDQKYVNAGNNALKSLQVRHPNGPMTDMSDLDPSLSSYIFFQEYLTDPHAYTLNGYIFILLGLYDWSQITKSEIATDLFNRGTETLIKILPYYEAGPFTTYDLGHITHAAPPYQKPRLPNFIARVRTH